MRKIVRIIGISLLVILLMGCGSSNLDGFIGNSNENFRNRGWVAENKDWTFLVVENKIYRMKDDGSDLQIIFEGSNYSPKFLNVVDNRLYFDCGGIIEMKDDGSDAKGIYNEYYYDFDTEIKKEFGIYAVGDYVYLGVNSRIALKDYSMEKIADYTEVHYQTVNFSKDYIWFYDEEENNLLKMKLDGTDLQLVSSTFDTADGIAIDGEYIYATTAYGNELFKVKSDGSTDEKLVDEGRASSPLILDNGLIYCNYYESGLFLNDECFFSVIDLDGNLQEIIAEDELETIGVTENWIYYQLHLDDNVYRYNKESKETEIIDFEQAKSNKYSDEQKDLFSGENKISVAPEKAKKENKNEEVIKNSSTIEMSEECKEIYSQIIEAVESQKNEEKIYFREIFFSKNVEIPDDGAGGVSNGYTLESSDMVFYLEDISENADGIPELFIGVKDKKDIKIIAIYTYRPDEHIAEEVAVVDDEWRPDIYWGKNGSIMYGKTGSELRYMAITKEHVMSFPAYNDDDGCNWDELSDDIITVENLNWEKIDKW